MLACIQGASDSLRHPSPGGETETSAFGIAVRVLLRAMSPSHCMVSSPAMGRVIPCYVFSWLSFLERGCGVLYFRHGFCAEHSGPYLVPRFAGFTVLAQPTRDNRNGRLLYPVRAVKGYLVRFRYASSAMRAVPFCRTV